MQKLKPLFFFILCLPHLLLAQQKKIEGTVINATDKTRLIGVTIRVKGSDRNAMTDEHGKFTILADAGDVLQLTYIGYAPQLVTLLPGQTTIHVMMELSNSKMDEVVVVGYGAMKKSAIATSITSVKPSEFNVSGGRDARSLLEGKVAGLIITRTGGSSPNTSVSVQLRGVVSLSGDKEPLVVIDGIPDGNLDLLHAEDIESIEVLKDGAAAAIYGSRGNAGVILVTTKKGTSGSNKVEYSTKWTRYALARKPQFMNAAEYRSLMTKLGNPSYMTDNGSSTDFYQELINKNNTSQTHNLALTGGNTTTTYRASLYYDNLNGLAKKDQRKQYGGRFSLLGKAFYDLVTYQTEVASNFNKADLLGNAGWESSLGRNPTTPIYNEDGTFYENASTSNPSYVARLAQQKYLRDQQTTSVNGKLTAEPVKGLKASTFGSVQRNSYADNVYYDKDSKASVDNYDGGGYAYKYTYLQTKYALEPTLEYAKNFGPHAVNAIGGYSYQYAVYEDFSASNYGFLSDATEENDIGAGSGLTAGNSSLGSYKEDETLIAFFGRLNYSYKNRYVAQASIRREGSSKFGKNNKWGSFPSVSVAWNISNEDFMKPVELVSNLKLRIGYGVTGNSGISPYQSIALLGTGGYYINDEGEWVQTYGPSNNVNYYLKWEKKKETNIGIDFGILKNRVTGTIDVFNRKTNDLLATANSAVPSLLSSTVTSNIGSISSKGVEIGLSGMPVSGKDFSWRVDFNGSTTTNRLETFSNDPDAEYKEYGNIGGFGSLGYSIRTYAGDKIGNFYGKRFAGFDDNGDWLFYTKGGEKVSADEIADEDLGVIGNAVPKFYASLSNYFRYKNFDLNIGLRGKFGFSVLNRTEMFYGNKTALAAGYNVLKSVAEGKVYSSYQYSDYYIEKGDFVKLDNITLGYSFRGKPELKIPSFRAYISCRDLLTITGYKGLDPEVEDTGLEPGMEATDRTPITRTFTLGLNVQF